ATLYRHSCSALPSVDNRNTSYIRSAGTEQTDRPLRRCRTTSFGKLSHFFQTGGSSSINSALSDLSITGKLIVKIAESQQRGIESLAQWARNTDNAAIYDVVKNSKRLYEMLTVKELEFARHYDRSLKQLKKITDSERAVENAEKDVADLEEKERKLTKEIEKGISFFKQRRGGDVYLLKQKLEEVKIAKARAERFLSDFRAEMEVIKMYRFRDGMQGIADAYQNLAKSCQAIFNCQREIVEMVPAVSNQDVRSMIYRGTSLTRDRVEDLRRFLEHDITRSVNNSWSNIASHSNRRRSEPLHFVHRLHLDSPPPPYADSVISRKENSLQDREVPIKLISEVYLN
ncbi:unnamed protein product, partial [Thelazia callipaeda]|uniref:F-BAR domain-containing protein n=1 Tax=Thelazia callipaeda TaxID=103827 RepID=A0A0N5CKN8_THECL